MFTKKVVNENTQKLQNYGYFHYKNPNFFSPINLMSQTLKRINDMNLPVFGFVYDEFWSIQYQIEDLLNGILGEIISSFRIFGHGLSLKANQGGLHIEIRVLNLYLATTNLNQ